MIVMRPEVVEFEFSGDERLLVSIAQNFVQEKFPGGVSSGYEDGVIDDYYSAKLMEVKVYEAPEDPLEEIVAPGIP
jgi:hypothetical protein